jgi:hypothetical protein
VSLKAYYELLLLKTDQMPLVSARSSVVALASHAMSFHVCFAPDSDGNADIAEGPSWTKNGSHALQSRARSLTHQIEGQLVVLP